MSEPIDDGGAAFPFQTDQTMDGYNGTKCGEMGMTLRDWFAGQALAGIKANIKLCEICSNVPGMTQPEAIAKMAYVDADAMIATRKTKP